MGFSSIEANQLVEKMLERNLLGHGAGRLILELAKTKKLSIREAGAALLSEQYWEQLPA
jgi:D-ornithine 4,5-aminomutase subunit alpha